MKTKALDIPGSWQDNGYFITSNSSPTVCQSLDTNCAEPTDVTFLFIGFAARGGATGYHANGFDVVFSEDKACHLFIDNQSVDASLAAELVKHHPIRPKNVISHIRKATQGTVRLGDCHPFIQELWGWHWIFVHNGDLKNFSSFLSGVYQSVGDTDSELTFCFIMRALRKRFPGSQPPLNESSYVLSDITREITRYGVFNFLFCNRQAQFVHCSTQLCHVVRQWPFSTAHLIGTDMAIDFAKYAMPADCIVIIATIPLTDNEVWAQFASDKLLVFESGRAMMATRVSIPETVQITNATSTACT